MAEIIPDSFSIKAFFIVQFSGEKFRVFILHTKSQKN